MSIATKTGDDGTTALLFGRRVAKTDPRIAANGAVDELNAALGMVRATVAEPFVTDAVLAIQKELVLLMGELAVLPEDRERYAAGGFHFVEKAMVDSLTARVDDLEKNHHISYHGWATPGATLGSAALDLARTVCRRAGEWRNPPLPQPPLRPLLAVGPLDRDAPGPSGRCLREIISPLSPPPPPRAGGGFRRGSCSLPA